MARRLIEWVACHCRCARPTRSCPRVLRRVHGTCGSGCLGESTAPSRHTPHGHTTGSTAAVACVAQMHGYSKAHPAFGEELSEPAYKNP